MAYPLRSFYAIFLILLVGFFSAFALKVLYMIFHFRSLFHLHGGKWKFEGQIFHDGEEFSIWLYNLFKCLVGSMSLEVSL